MFLDISASPSPEELNKRGDSYYVIFAYHGQEWDEDPNVRSLAGHAWVIWGHEDHLKSQTTISAYGYYRNTDLVDNGHINSIATELSESYPITGMLFKQIITDGRLHQFNTSPLGVLLGGNSVAGILKSDILAGGNYNTVHQMVVKVDKKDYDNSLLVLKDYKNNPGQYGYIRRDCVEFVIDVGYAVGFDMPARDWSTMTRWRPADYMHLFFNAYLAPNRRGIYDDETAQADYNGNYVAWEIKQPTFNGRTGYEDENGNYVDVLMEQDQVRCGTINYKNGDKWKYAGDGSTFFSEYRFANGNTLKDFDGINKQEGIVRKANGNVFVGGISNSGNENGRCIFYNIDSRDETKVNSYYYGIFDNGKFIEYLPVGTTLGNYYGTLKDNQCHGKGRLEYTNRGKYVGNFTNGVIDGNGKFYNPDGSTIDGSFRNGIPEGYCIWINRNGEHKGLFKNGIPNGSGTFKSNDGYVYECQYENGLPVSGKCTRPDGTYFRGNFVNGRMASGTNYTASGTVIAEASTGSSSNSGTNTGYRERDHTSASVEFAEARQEARARDNSGTGNYSGPSVDFTTGEATAEARDKSTGEFKGVVKESFNKENYGLEIK